MGYWIELRTMDDKATDSKTLISLLKKNNVAEHPDYENEYLLKNGILIINKPGLINKGIPASIRLSWASTKDNWFSLIELSRNLGCQLYDPATNEFISETSIPALCCHGEQI